MVTTGYRLICLGVVGRTVIKTVLLVKSCPTYGSKPINPQDRHGGRRTGLCRFLFLACFALLWLNRTSSLVAAQEVTIQGTVQDTTRAVLWNANVKLYRQDQLVAETHSAPDGTFRIAAPAGTYRIEITAPSFSALEEMIEIRAGMNPLSYQLRLAPMQQTLDVPDEPYQISLQPDRNLSGLVLDETAIQQLPDNEEDLAQLLQDLAGPGADVVGGTEISTDGFSGGRLPPREQIREIRINNNPFSSERSRPGNGRIEIITRAGTDALRGNVAFQLRDDALNARNAFADTKPPYQRRNWRGNLSGPLLREKMSFSLFAMRSHSQDSDSISATTLAGPVSAAVVRPNNREEYNGKIQYQLPKNHSLNVSLEYGSNTRGNQGVGGFALPERATESESRDWNLQVREIALLSERMVHESRFAFRRERSQTTPVMTEGSTLRSTCPLDVACNVLDAFQGGGGTDFNRDTERNYQFADQLNYIRGALSLKIGFQGEYRRYETLNRDNFRGSFVFSDLDAFAAGQPITFTINSGNPALDMNQLEWAGFLQNDYRVSPKLLLSFGLRYEAQTNVSDHNNVDPRLGFAYSVDGASVIRGGAGLFHQRLGAGTVQSVLRLDGTRQIQTVIEEPSYPDPFTESGTQNVKLPASVREMAAGLATPYTANASISFETRLPKELFVSAGYNFVRGIHLYRSRNINAPLPGQTERPDPSRGNVLVLESSASSRYHELSFRVNQRIGSSSFNFNYTLSASYNNTGGIFSLPANNYDLIGEWGRASEYRRHALFARYNFELPWKISAHTGVRANSGRPYNITTGLDDNGDTNANDRPDGVTRNTGNGPGSFEVDLGVRKTFLLRRSNSRPGARSGSASGPATAADFQGGRGGGGQRSGRRDLELAISANISNLLNHTNFSRFSGVMSSPFFGRANSTRPPREIELGIQINF